MTLDELIELGDPDGLLFEIDRLSSLHDYEGLFELRNRCRLAVERGKQLWGVASHAEYRLALEAPASIAAAVFDSPPSPFAIGPLPEVAASRHTWAELSPHLAESPTRGVVAYERVARGEDLTADRSLIAHVSTFELPLVRMLWEPDYEAPVFDSASVLAARPISTVLQTIHVDKTEYVEIDEPETREALEQVVKHWQRESNGSVASCAVEGGVAEAMSALYWADSDAHRISFTDAVAMLVWAGASGGAEGRRRGMSVGRSTTWWALAAVAGLLEDWPVDPGEAASELEWWTWGSNDPDDIELAIAAVDPVDEVAFGLFAVDAKR